MLIKPFKFTPRTVFPNYNVVTANFMGHHRAALKKMAGLSTQIDMVIELRDSRIPLSSMNGLLDKFLVTKHKIVLYTKNDLSNLSSKTIGSWHALDHSQYAQINCKSKEDASKVLNMVKKTFNDVELWPPLGVRLLIVGMPNAGKSTFLNTLRSVGLQEHHKVAKTGENAGVTRKVSNIVCIHRDPDIFIYDSPGVFVPRTKDVETMLKFSIIGAVPKARVDPVIQADYLLFHINKFKEVRQQYRKYLSKPTNQIYKLLKAIATKRNVLKRDGSFDEKAMALYWVKSWRDGAELPMILDEDLSEEAYVKALLQQREMYKDFQMDMSREIRYNKRKMLRK